MHAVSRVLCTYPSKTMFIASRPINLNFQCASDLYLPFSLPDLQLVTDFAAPTMAFPQNNPESYKKILDDAEYIHSSFDGAPFNDFDPFEYINSTFPRSPKPSSYPSPAAVEREAPSR